MPASHGWRQESKEWNRGKGGVRRTGGEAGSGAVICCPSRAEVNRAGRAAEREAWCVERVKKAQRESARGCARSAWLCPLKACGVPAGDAKRVLSWYGAIRGRQGRADVNNRACTCRERYTGRDHVAVNGEKGGVQGKKRRGGTAIRVDSSKGASRGGRKHTPKCFAARYRVDCGTKHQLSRLSHQGKEVGDKGDGGRASSEGGDTNQGDTKGERGEAVIERIWQRSSPRVADAAAARRGAHVCLAAATCGC